MSARREGSAGQQVLPVAACLNLSPFAWVTFPCCAVRLRQCWFLPLIGSMDFSKEGCRFYTFTRWKLGKKATEIREELLQVFPDSTPSLETVSRWIRAFAAGKTQLEDDHRSGRPRTSVTEATTVRARAIIDEDPTVTLRFLSLELDVSYGSAHDIVHQHLGLRKKCARWIPHMLTEEKKSERVRICRLWLSEFEPNGPKRFSDVATGDECWIFFFINRDKQSNMVWLSDEEPQPQILKEGFRSRKRLFHHHIQLSGINVCGCNA